MVVQLDGARRGLRRCLRMLRCGMSWLCITLESKSIFDFRAPPFARDDGLMVG
jgi:hypothetical protein